MKDVPMLSWRTRYFFKIGVVANHGRVPTYRAPVHSLIVLSYEPEASVAPSGAKA
eukprot:SAG31_NODE_22872_length_516_cov_0.937650_2_plen_54_part_01